jgi:hypothetical protein
MDIDKPSTLQYVLTLSGEETVMHVSLPPDLKHFVETQVHSGRYTSA